MRPFVSRASPLAPATDRVHHYAMFLPDWVPAAITLVILAAAIYSFVRDLLPADITALAALLALLVTGVLDAREAFSGFGHPATVSVAAVLVLSAGLERTGALGFLARRILAPLGRSEFLLTLAVMVLIGALSAFINNTAAVAVFIPVVLEACRRSGASPGRVLMPMSHAATLGGMCTLIGTSTNLAAHEFARSQGLSGFGMFELGRVGCPVMLAGFAYMLLVGRWFLPRTPHAAAAAAVRPGTYLAAVIVQPESPWIGREIRADRFARDHDLELLEVLRSGQSVLSPAGARYAAGDRMRVRGTLEHVLALGSARGLRLHRPGERDPLTGREAMGAGEAAPGGDAPEVGGEPATAAEPSTRFVPQWAIRLAQRKSPAPAVAPAAKPEQAETPAVQEMVVLPASGLIGRSLRDARFADRYDAIVLAIHRPGADLAERPEDVPIHGGDVLVVEGGREALKRLAGTRGFLLVGAPEQPEGRPGKVGIAALTLAGVVLVAALGWMPIVTAATAGCIVLIVTRCLEPREAYRAIDLSIVFLLAGAIALGTALDKTGIARQVGTWLAGLTPVAGPHVLLAGFFLAAMLLSELMSNSGTVLLLAPIALSSAQQAGVNPLALLAAVTFGASAAFVMPIGYQTSLMIYGPGGYRFRDFVWMGVPLDLIVLALAVSLIPLYWPL